jgi:hypothetical protein
MDPERFLKAAIEDGLPPRKFLQLAAIGCLTHGALYLILVFVAALRLERLAAAELAAAAVGVVYLSCAAYTLRFNVVGVAFNCLSIVCGVAAGLLLVW